MKLKHILILVLVILIGWFIYDTLSIPSVDDLKGDFKEVAMYRNENNTGPIVRVYAVTVNDTLWQEMQAYGDYMPHTKYGNTKVYFFHQDTPAPGKVYAGEANIDAQFNTYVLARYEKDAMGQVSFIKHPYK
ncbi:hypothetical protein ABID22_001356 [Pontibacter aydingkolensis]|uniref:Uncharacterized protein n=1 Tax=Pontibacter aydingkolensis TaxID=1911536 RepID=A0ABS7CNV0_9BACT|nr:hypothetical protein [Pontibacter aydingkolensis]MBW7465521.1 hypothetical protein [Pontibacter aydingkolensis]